ncbi:MAG: ureidoglycolate lyase [Actinobacteria bacterium]|nr:ureidoglycolate lyase [Actinomycetota bacterium]
MKKFDLKVEPIKYVSEESFKPYGQIFGLEKGKPTEDYIFLKCWWKNIDIEVAANEKIGFNYCKIDRMPPEDTEKARQNNTLADWLKNFKGGASVTIMERHPTTDETFFFLEGDAIFVMAPPDPSKSKPDISRARAFLLDRSVSVSLWKGTWHWPPIPVYQYTRFCIVCTGTLDDFDRVDLDVELQPVL